MFNSSLSKKEISLVIIFYAIVIVVAIFISTKAIGLCITKTSSMQGTLNVNDYYIENKIAYKFGKLPQRGDIVDFKFPETGELYAKRVLGLPNETVQIKNGIVYINGEAIDEPYLSSNSLGDFGPYAVPAGTYFMMGDNRNESYDSRQWKTKYIPIENIEGRVWGTFSDFKLRVF